MKHPVIVLGVVAVVGFALWRHLRNAAPAVNFTNELAHAKAQIVGPHHKHVSARHHPHHAQP